MDGFELGCELGNGVVLLGDVVVGVVGVVGMLGAPGAGDFCCA